MEAKIKKMKEMFNKDLEELKNKQTNERYNNRNEKYTRRNQQQITEAEELISDLEDRIVEITAVEQNKEKRMKINEDSLRTTLNTPTFALQGSQKEKRERKDLRKYLKK